MADDGQQTSAAQPSGVGPLPSGSAINPLPSPATPLHQFRGTDKRLKIHPLENALLVVIAAHLVFLPWALGAVRLPAQIVSLTLATLSLILALWRRTYTAEHTGGQTIRLSPIPRLLKFPIFWFGLLLLGLITVQALNPAWEYHTNGRMWWMRRIDSIAWLPSGIRAPFNPVPGAPLGGPWRMLLVYASAFMTVCALWVGFTRRRTLQRLFIVLAANGVLLSLFGIAQRILRFDRIFGLIDSPNASFFASFIYKNHAGAYLFICVVIASGLGAWYYVRGVRRLEKSSPAGLFGFFLTCIAVSVLISYARGATFIMLAYLCVAVGVFIYYQWKLPPVARSPVITIALLLVFGFFLKTGMEALHSDLAWDRLKQAMSGEDVSVESRMAANRASLQMLGDSWAGGIGSGSFPFLFPAYEKRVPEIAHYPDGRPVFWPHAHNDILELPIELGIAGVVLILASFAYWGFFLLRNYAWENPLSGAVVVGCLFLVGMSWGDFVFYCPAVLITWCALWPLCARWAQLEEQRSRP